MKPETVHTLVVARTLFEFVSRNISSDNEHIASSSLIVLQDAVELVLLSVLLEIGADQNKNLESLTFDQIIGELRHNGITVPKSGTLKAMNKQRVIVKHYGQLAEPKTVQNYVDTCHCVVNIILRQTIGLDLQSVMIHELLPDGESKELLFEASRLIDREDYFQSLLYIRRAIYVEIEIEYNIEEWSIHTDNPFERFMRRGHKAPHRTRSKEWIEANVKDPCDYIQIDHEQMRLDLLEWGVNTQDYWNLSRLTPKVYRRVEGEKWYHRIDTNQPKSTKADAEFCLDKAISIIAKKKSHDGEFRARQSVLTPLNTLEFSTDGTVLERAEMASQVIEAAPVGTTVFSERAVIGFDNKVYYYIVWQRPQGFVIGYVPAEQLTHAPEPPREPDQIPLPLGMGEPRP